MEGQEHLAPALALALALAPALSASASEAQWYRILTAGLGACLCA